MKISYRWLQSYIDGVLPAPHDLEQKIIFHVSEVEEVEQKGDDYIFDIKTLPDRNHDLLSHQGMAREIAGLLGLPFKDPTPLYKIPISSVPVVGDGLTIHRETDTCRRYAGRIIRNIKVGDSPEWIKTHLESIGQRSINNIVDATNLVMFDCGQPLHAFDVKKLTHEKIVIRQALDGETMTTLDGKEVILKSSDAVITDGANILALAGVKGGMRAQVDEETTDIIIEVANFDPSSIRRTARRVGILTDATKRFENDLSPELVDFAMKEITGLILELCPDAICEESVDVYPHKQEERKITFSLSFINKKLGSSISAEEVEKILTQYQYLYTKQTLAKENNKDNKDEKDEKDFKDTVFEITVPPLRLDLIMPEDMVEEIGRVIGYDTLPNILPVISSALPIEKEKMSEWQHVMTVKEHLVSQGYREVFTYTFTHKGDVEVLASASDKNFLRTNLSDGLKESIILNQRNAPLLGLDEVKVFEVGTVFLKNISASANSSSEIQEEMRVAYGNKKSVTEMAVDEYVKKNNILAAGKEQAPAGERKRLEDVFMMWSVHPFISRDIAVWLSSSEDPLNLVRIIKEQGKELLITEPRLVDQYEKEGRISYAYRFVFQSYERTLSDEEVSAIMENIYSACREKGWEVR